MMQRRRLAIINILAMSEVLHKFPSTPHLAWLGQRSVRDDKVLTPSEAGVFLSGPVVVEEKVDGANLGISIDAAGRLRFQNRGNWLEGKLTGQWECLRGWTAKHELRLRQVLPENHVLFGEWCYIAHSIRYEYLPDLFLIFDVYDTTVGRFWSTSRRNALAEAVRLSLVPKLARGVFKQERLHTFLNGRSDLSGGPREGLYLRREDDDWVLNRAKLVRSDFTQAISEHWSRQGTVLNKVRRASSVGVAKAMAKERTSIKVNYSLEKT